MLKLSLTLSLLIILTIPGCQNGSSGLIHKQAIGALGPYSGSVQGRGLIFVSGKIGERGGSFERETETALDAVEAELQRSGATLDDVVQATVFLTDLDFYGAFNEIYAQRMGDPYPARACVEVSRLPGGAKVEIQVIAIKP